MRSFILAAALVLSLGGSLVAQAPTLESMEVVIPQQQRQGAFQSGSKLIDDSVPGNILIIQADINLSDYVDPLNSLWIRLYRSVDNGATWLPSGGGRWRGGPFTDSDGNVNPMPSFSTWIPNYRGMLIRAELDIPRRMRVGATIFTVTE